MSPDNRRHRGAHPADQSLFNETELPKLCQATVQLSWLLTHGYKMASSLKLVGDRHGLIQRQRLAVSRAACSDQNLEQRRRARIPIDHLKNQDVIIDGFNLIITIEAALSQGPLLACRDGCIRDLSSVHGSYRSVEETERAINLIGEALHEFGPSGVQWVLDRPVSNSGRLASRIAEIASGRNWTWEVEVVFNPDSEIVASESVAITSDSSILDSVQRWADLKSYLVTQIISNTWLIDLRTL